MQPHERVGLVAMAAAEGARAAKDIYEHVQHIRAKHRTAVTSDKPLPRRRRHFDWGLCAVICVGAIVPALFYSGEVFS